MFDPSERSTRLLFDPELLGRYLAGECSDAEAAAVRRTLMANPAAARALARALEELDGGAPRSAAPDAAASWAALRERLRTPVGAEVSRPVTEPALAEPAAAKHEPAEAPGSATRARAAAVARRRPTAAWWQRPRRTAAAWAAGVCLAALAGGTMLKARRGLPAPSSGVRLADSTAPGGRLYVTAPGQRAEVLLRDGTRVRLAPASRLRVATDYGAGRRDVYLDGEAFFDVTHDARRPFTVFAANASARDLGTQFSVRSYADEGTVEVLVREGAVALSGVGPLAAGDVGRLTARGRTNVRRGVDADAALGWLDGRLTFHDAPLAQVLRDVGRWYDIDVSADSALAALPFTGTLAGGSADEAVELVAATLALHIQNDGRRRVLHTVPGRTPHGAPSRREQATPPVQRAAPAPAS